MKRFYYWLIAGWLPPCFALSPKPSGIGQVAENLMAPVGFFADFVHSGCVILGAAFLFASIVKYFEHKKSPLMIPISTVVYLFVGGVLLLAIPILSFL